MLHILSSSLHKEALALPYVLPESFTADHQCVAVLTGGSEALFMERIEQGSVTLDKPVYIFSTENSNSLAASLEILSWVQQHGGKGRVFTPDTVGGLNESAQSTLDNTAVSTHTVQGGMATREMRLGVVGKPSDWLIASRVDAENVYERFGIRLVDVPIEEMTSLGVVDGGADGAERIYQRLKEIVVKYDLQGVTLRCFDLLSTVQNTGCMALSHLNDEGIPAACEGDIPLLLTMVLARMKYGKTGFQVNPARIYADGRMLFAHCTIPLSMTTSHELTTHFESGIGVGIHGELPTGEYRLMKLSADLGQLLDEPVMLTANQYEPNLCRTQVWLQATPALAGQLLEHPLANHHLLVKV